MSDLTDVGTGVNLFTAGQVRGTARWFHDTSDVLSIDDDDLEETIAFVNKGGMTFLSPILPDLKAIVCTAGSRESHLAILSRESDVPCVLAAQLSGEITDGSTVVLDLSDPETARISIAAGVAA
ncbi:PEP-utilising enzyme, mobile domain [Pseudonocardia thermophila]|jgi:Phosphoenolpyruvate-protein kinase (PTS system EI component in bacteria)|uniref:PEP-utilising enzyme, mobile domain n=1 Tax=Pseudonocardia thermophila TaxID=1848 RepID=A0A1M7AJF8_PSETH|nr:PEP-utilizing enzyme [Pseudonocardia thermophila]SHL42900.1 PEP-utilising enzyme, mobile domain [Pseudonocardia thermophila]